MSVNKSGNVRIDVGMMIIDIGHAEMLEGEVVAYDRERVVYRETDKPDQPLHMTDFKYIATKPVPPSLDDEPEEENELAAPPPTKPMYFRIGANKEPFPVLPADMPLTLEQAARVSGWDTSTLEYMHRSEGNEVVDKRDIIQEWRNVLDDRQVYLALTRLREQVPLPVPMSTLVEAMIRMWDECSGEARIEMITEALGMDKDAMPQNTLFNDTEGGGAAVVSGTE